MTGAIGLPCCYDDVEVAMEQDEGIIVSKPLYSTVVSPNDHMWDASSQFYFDIGISAIDCIKRSLAAVNLTPMSILDFPCGHGRVCRMLRTEYPKSYLAACDLDPDGADFCAAQFGAEPFYSRQDIREVTLPRSFDLIWCGSLFTHLDRDRWHDFLEFFVNHLTPDGVVVFTTHGRQPIQWMTEGFFGYGLSAEEQRAWMQQYARHGFGFQSPSSQAFGLSLSSMAFVCAQIERWPSLKVIGLHEAAWAGHQDVVSCMKLRKPYTELASTER